MTLFGPRFQLLHHTFRGHHLADYMYTIRCITAKDECCVHMPRAQGSSHRSDDQSLRSKGTSFLKLTAPSWVCADSGNETWNRRGELFICAASGFIEYQDLRYNLEFSNVLDVRRGCAHGTSTWMTQRCLGAMLSQKPFIPFPSYWRSRSRSRSRSWDMYFSNVSWSHPMFEENQKSRRFLVTATCKVNGNRSDGPPVVNMHKEPLETVEKKIPTYFARCSACY
jgi:hypothetical protein